MDFKTCEVVQELQYYDNIDELENRIKQLPQLSTYTYIVHDKDLKENGMPKPIHFHCVITFSDNVTGKTISKILKVPEQYIEKIKTTTKLAREYHVHLNDPDKYQYDPLSVKGNIDYMKLIASHKKANLKDLYRDAIVNGDIKQYDYTEKIPSEFYTNNRKYIENCFKYRADKLAYNKRGNRNMECVFIQGSSGVGKTTFAKMFAERSGLSYFISSGGKKPLDDYKGQECIILDDLRDDTFSFPDLLKLTDNNTQSFVGCRYYNKSIYECKLIIATSTKRIDQFYAETTEQQEEKTQLLRRFKSLMVMEDQYITIFEYDDIQHDYVSHHKKLINPVYALRKCSEINSPLTQKLLGFITKTNSENNAKEDEPHFEEVPDNQMAFDKSLFDLA